MNNKKLNNNVSYSTEKMEDKMDNKKLYIDELIKKDELYHGLVVDGLLVVNKLIYNNKFINNQLMKVYSRGIDMEYNNRDWSTINEDLIQDTILLTLEAGKEAITFKEFYRIVRKVLYKNLKHWNREVESSSLTARSNQDISDYEKLDNYLLDNSSYIGYESVEKQVIDNVYHKQIIDELVRVCTPSQASYIREYAKQGSHNKLSGVKNRILKNAKRSLMLRELYNI